MTFTLTKITNLDARSPSVTIGLFPYQELEGLKVLALEKFDINH